MSRRYTPVADDTVVVVQRLTEERWDANTCTLDRVRTTLHVRATVVYVRRRGDYQVETGSGPPLLGRG